MSAEIEDRTLDPVEGALKTYPLAPAPSRLKNRVMQAVRTHPRPRPLAFTWLEGSLGLLIATMLTAASYLVANLSSVRSAILTQEIRRILFSVLHDPVAIAAILGLGLIGLTVFAAAAVFAIPWSRRRFVRLKTR